MIILVCLTVGAIFLYLGYQELHSLKNEYTKEELFILDDVYVFNLYSITPEVITPPIAHVTFYKIPFHGYYFYNFRL